MSFSERLKQAMEYRNFRQVDLVKKTGIDKGTISNYLSGKYKPKSMNTYLIAEALNVDLQWLLGYDVPMEINQFVEYTPPKDEDDDFLKIEFSDLDPNITKEAWDDYYPKIMEMPEQTRIDVLKMIKLSIVMSDVQKKFN